MISNHYSISSLQKRFLTKFKILENGCWEWIAYKSKGGYGQIGKNKIIDKAHRASYELYIGDIPIGYDVCHSCDNPNCVSPFHLFSATHKDNMNDARQKGRLPQFKHPSRRAYDKGCRCPDCIYIINAARRRLYHSKKEKLLKEN